MRRGGSATPSSALAARMVGWGELLTNSGVDGLDPLVSFEEELWCEDMNDFVPSD